MHNDSSVPIKHSIATQLLKRVFSMYLALVLTLTVIHIATEYTNTKAGVLKEIQSLEMTVKSGVSQALWEMNIPQTRSIMRGIVQLPIIVGVSIEDHNGHVVGQTGQVIDLNDRNIAADKAKNLVPENQGTDLFGHTFPLFYNRSDQEFPVGKVTLYSNSGVVFNRLSFGFSLLIFNMCVQVIAFWALFLWISRVKLSRPLSQLTHAAGQLDLDNLETSTIQVHTSGRNELKIMEETFNTMIKKLLTARQKHQSLNRRLQLHRDELEQRINERTAALHKSEAHLLALFAGMNDLVLLLDSKGRYLKIAPTSQELLYKPAKEMLGKTLHEVHSKDEADFFQAHIYQSLKSQQLVLLEYSMDINGKDVWFNGRISPMPDETVVFVARDVTEQKKIEAQLRQAKERAESANHAKSAFLANMSHELRTPLNAIIGFSELMTRDLSLSHEQQENLSTIIHSGDHLLSLINDVLEFSKIEAEGITLHPENFDLHRLISDLEEMLHLRARQKKIYLSFEHADSVFRYIRADQGKLRQILINLLGNAIKFTKAGKVNLRVTGRKEASDMCSLQFEITDTGPGIASEEQDKVFDAFFQADNRQPAHKGTGLGLPISQRFVDMMGGTLILQSIAGQGTTFSFTINVQLIDRTLVPSLKIWPLVIGIKPDSPIHKLLVVEDNRNNRNLLVSLLRSVGFTVYEAKNGLEAINVWEEWQPHLIFMDLRMPVMDGYEAITHIKTSGAERETVIIALTASAFESDRLKVLTHGGDDFIRKPFREYEIFEMLSKHLGAKFIYKTKSEDQKNKSAMSSQKMQQDIAELPEELKNDFKTAVDKIDFEKGLILLEDIQKINENLANALTEAVNGYQFDVLQGLFEVPRK